jgi:beta-glucosidase
LTDTMDTQPLFRNPNLPPADRARDLIARMTLAEKVSQMMDEAPSIERLGIPAYPWWNEALHGVARAGTATVFPQAIGIAATWNEDLVFRMANAISDEARAKHHEALRRGDHSRYTGLTFWSPNINIFRDPRWGRGQETYGEDPYLTSRIGVQFVRGMQGDDPHYLKTAACAKHFAVHSGPEADRHHFDAQVGQRDLLLTYLPAFKALVRDADVAGVMGAYNRVNGEPCCASPYLLGEILRERWGFSGYIVSDCGAIQDIYRHHQVADTPEEAAGMAVQAGCNLNCGCTYEHLLLAVGHGWLSESEIDTALEYLFTIRFRLGMFDPPEKVPYTHIPIEVNDSPANQALALEVARQSLVLLKNEGQLLPLSKNLDSIAVIGPNADNPLVLLGNYYGTPSDIITPLEGIWDMVKSDTSVRSAHGCEILAPGQDGFSEAVSIASKADVAVVVLGLSQQVEGEEGQEEGNPPGVLSRGDRTSLDLPGEQQALLEAVAATGTPVVLVLLNGSAVAINWADEHIPAILEAWYPGQAGGRAIAQALFGDTNPGGKLPVTFYRSVDQLPPFEDYALGGRTYRYFDDEPLYPFGYGLSYTQFAYQNLSVSPTQMHQPEVLWVSCEVKNTGDVPGDEVVQVYLRDDAASVPVPRHSLVGFKRVHLAPGAVEYLRFEIQPRQYAIVHELSTQDYQWAVEPGSFTIFVGGGQPGAAPSLSATIAYTGEWFNLAP